MGWVKKHLCSVDQTVKGCIVALNGDSKLEHALHRLDSITFVRYEVDFLLLEGFGLSCIMSDLAHKINRCITATTNLTHTR